MFVMDRGQSLIVPHLFDGTNYAYWKERVRASLQSLDEKVASCGDRLDQAYRSTGRLG